MSLSTLGLDVYQLTTLVAHAAAGRLDATLAMSFFFRKLPKGRNYVVAAGLRSLVEHAEGLRFTPGELAALHQHPVIGPSLAGASGQAALQALGQLDGFTGEIDALPEGTLAFAGPALRLSGEPLTIAGAPLIAYTPLLQVRCDLTSAKLIETPWLSRLNHLSMVASKAARVVSAATCDGQPRAVIEFGQRRTHPEAAVDASYAAYLGGCSATSNLAATFRHGVPSVGTMDHFAIQACERPGQPVGATESAFFAEFCDLFPHAATLLVDTYDTLRGVRNAVTATGGRLQAVRLDSQVTPASVREVRALLDSLGAPHVRIFVSDGLDEWRVRELAQAGAAAFGVGENITCVPDAACGVGAVGKLVRNGYGKPTMKLARGSGKATLPETLQVHRYPDRDVLTLWDEAAPPGGQPLLQPLWRGKDLVAPLPSLQASREHVQAQIAALPPHLRALETDHGRPWPIYISDGLHQVVARLVAEALEAPAEAAPSLAKGASPCG